MVATTDYFRRVAAANNRAVVTSLQTKKTNGTSTAELALATGWVDSTTSAVDIVIYRKNASTGLPDSSTQTDWVALRTGTTLSSMVLKAGVEPSDGYAADSNTVVMCTPTAAWANDLIVGLLQSHNPNGTLLTSAVQTALSLGAGSLNGWNALAFTPTSVVCNGNRSYTLTFSQDVTGTLSAGMRWRTQRTVAAPTQCTNLNGTNQYFSKTTPVNMSVLDDFVTHKQIKISAYPTAYAAIESTFNGTNGWTLGMNTDGTIELVGFNGGGANNSKIKTYQSVPLNKWVDITAQLDMSSFTATPTTSYIMLDGVDVPSVVSRTGTNPTALGAAATQYQLGAQNGAQFFPGKIAQSAVFNAKVTQSTMQGYISQGLTGTEPSVISVHSFNGNANDLNTTNANNLTSNNGASATTADSPFGGQADGTISSTLDYGIIQKATFSTSSTVIVQVPEGCTIPTSGGISAVAYSANKSPYGFPSDKGKWMIEMFDKVGDSAVNYSNSVWQSIHSQILTIPIGSWDVRYSVEFVMGVGGAVVNRVTLSTASGSESDARWTTYNETNSVSNSGGITHQMQDSLSVTTQAPYYLIGKQDSGVTRAMYSSGIPGKIQAYNAYL